MAIINISPDSNYLHLTVYELPPDPSNFTFDELFDVTIPGACYACNATISLKNPAYQYVYDFDLYKEGVLFSTGNTTGYWTGLCGGIYSVKFKPEPAFSTYPTYQTEYKVISAATFPKDFDVQVVDNYLQHIVSRNTGGVIVIAQDGTNSVTIWDENFNVLDTGIDEAEYIGVCAGTFYIRLTDGSCQYFTQATVRSVGTFTLAGVKRILYNINPSRYILHYDTDINIIKGLSVTAWREYEDFDEETSSLQQTITQNGATKEFTQTIEINVENHFNYGAAYTEFIKPSNREFAFLIQDSNDNWWYVGESVRARLTNSAIEQGESSNFNMTFESFQKQQLRQVAPSYISTVTISQTVTKSCEFSMSGIAKMWFGVPGGFPFIIYDQSIVNNQIIINGITGITFTQYVTNSSSSFAIDLVKDQNGQNYRSVINAGWSLIGDQQHEIDLGDDDTYIDFLYENELYVLIEDNNGQQWFFGKNNRVKLTDFSKATGEQNGYEVSFEGIDSAIYFGNNIL